MGIALLTLRMELQFSKPTAMIRRAFQKLPTGLSCDVCHLWMR